MVELDGNCPEKWQKHCFFWSMFHWSMIVRGRIASFVVRMPWPKLRCFNKLGKISANVWVFIIPKWRMFYQSCGSLLGMQSSWSVSHWDMGCQTQGISTIHTLNKSVFCGCALPDPPSQNAHIYQTRIQDPSRIRIVWVTMSLFLLHLSEAINTCRWIFTSYPGWYSLSSMFENPASLQRSHHVHHVITSGRTPFIKITWCCWYVTVTNHLHFFSPVRSRNKSLRYHSSKLVLYRHGTLYFGIQRKYIFK